jgi:hypothetical protein
VPVQVPPPAESSAEISSSRRDSFWQAQLGLRSTFVTDAGFDPFATDNALSSFSLGATRTIFASDSFSLAPGIFWDYGGRSANARGLKTSLGVHRIAASLEGRYHFAPWLYGMARVAPGALHYAAEFKESNAANTLAASGWNFALDASAGLAFLLGPHGSASARRVGWWLAAEGGYAYASSSSLVMSPTLADDDPRRVGDLDVGNVALGGGFFRIYGAVTF